MRLKTIKFDVHIFNSLNCDNSGLCSLHIKNFITQMLMYQRCKPKHLLTKTQKKCDPLRGFFCETPPTSQSPFYYSSEQVFLWKITACLFENFISNPCSKIYSVLSHIKSNFFYPVMLWILKVSKGPVLKAFSRDGGDTGRWKTFRKWDTEEGSYVFGGMS